MFVRRLFINYTFLFAALLLIYIFFNLIIKSIVSGKRYKKTIMDINKGKKEIIGLQITKQRLFFITWLTTLKLLGLFLPLLLSIKITFELLDFFRNIVISQSFDYMLPATAMEGFLKVNEVFFIISISPWVLYFIFSYILNKRILILKKAEHSPNE